MGRRRKGDPSVDGVLLIDKPEGWSSYDVIRRLKRPLGTSRLGHTGTLDPMATGLLVVCAGWSTRLVPYLSDGVKRYTGTIALGVSTTTDDREGEVVARVPVDVDDGRLAACVDALTGTTMQVPPAFSAIRVDGERAYAAARRGDEVQLEARPIHVSSFEVVRVSNAELRFDVAVSKGTYIRSLARDLGDALGCGAHLTSLRRTENAPFGVRQAIHPESVEGPDVLISPLEALRSFPRVTLSRSDVADVRMGRRVSGDGPGAANVLAAGVDAEHPTELVGLLTFEAEAGLWQPTRVRPVVAES